MYRGIIEENSRRANLKYLENLKLNYCKFVTTKGCKGFATKTLNEIMEFETMLIERKYLDIKKMTV